MNKLKKLMGKRETLLVIMIVVLSIIITIGNPTFLRIDSVLDLFKKNYVLFLIGIGEMVVILSGGIDISVGQGLNAIGLLTGYFMVGVCSNFVVGMIVAMLLGAGLGAINGFFVTKVKLHPWVQTIAMMNILQGLILFIQGGLYIDWVSDDFKVFNSFHLIEVKVGRATASLSGQILIVLAAVLLSAWILRFTRFGRSLFAVGGNADAALKAGIRVDTVRWLSYVFSGVMIGLASFISMSMSNHVLPFNFNGYELNAISITVLGGTALIGGVGSVFGTVLAIILLAIVKTGIVLLGISSMYELFVVGLILILAAAADAVKQSRREKSVRKVDVS